MGETMANNESNATKKPAGLDRRSVLAGGAATATTAGLPRAAMAQLRGEGGFTTFAAVYMDPKYLDTFNNGRYASGNIGAVHDLIKLKFPNRSNLKWGFYQRDVEPVPAKWGTTPQLGQAAFDNWPNFSQEARDDLEKQPAIFADPHNAINPSDPSLVAANMLEHLDEVIRIALWDHADIPVTIKVDKKKKRHHEFTTVWDYPPGSPSKLNGLTINVWCPDGGWEGYTLWRNNSAIAHITKLVATWKVPPAPSTDVGQIIFIFNGLESLTGPNTVGGILQPVLQWTTNGWAVRSWYVRADFDPVSNPQLPPAGTAVDQSGLANEKRCYSKAISVAVGQTITGTIEGGKDVSGKFNYTCSLTVDGSPTGTVLRLTDIPEPVYAVCAVESYGVTAKPPNPNYPADPITMTSVNLQVEQNSVSPIQWMPSKKAGKDYIASTMMAGQKIEFKLT
jgi:hypothetical protein